MFEARRITAEEARLKLNDDAMRRALYELIWEKTNPDSKLPCPKLSDGHVQAELRRILR